MVVRSELEAESGTGSGTGCDSAGQPGACVYTLHPHAVVPSPATCTGVAADTDATPSCEAAFAAASDTTSMSCPLGCTYTEEVVVDDASGRRRLEGFLLATGLPDVYDEKGRRRMQVPDDINIQMDTGLTPTTSTATPTMHDPTCLDGDERMGAGLTAAPSSTVGLCPTPMLTATSHHWRPRRQLPRACRGGRAELWPRRAPAHRK